MVVPMISQWFFHFYPLILDDDHWIYVKDHWIQPRKKGVSVHASSTGGPILIFIPKKGLFSLIFNDFSLWTILILNDIPWFTYYFHILKDIFDPMLVPMISWFLTFYPLASRFDPGHRRPLLASCASTLVAMNRPAEAKTRRGFPSKGYWNI